MARALVLATVALVACGDNQPTDSPDAQAPADAARDIAQQLGDLPGVTVSEQPPANAPAGYRYFVLEVTQPVDHAAPGGATFQQEVSLIHRDASAPMVLFTTGYDDYNHDYPSEPTLLLKANQISVEYRFFGTSRPDPADWSKLTIEQMADDEHAIVELLRPIYGAAWISTGGSKGGMTASYHRRFFPDDVAGTLAYVAPMSLAIPDERYAPFLAATGTEPCADDVRAAAKDMLQNRRAALLQRAQAQASAQQYAYTRIAIAPALESAIQDLEWSYWQYYGVSACSMVPALTATDDEMFAFLDEVSPVSFSDDPQTAEFEAYFYQAYAQLGSPGTVGVRGDLVAPEISAFAQFSDADYLGSLPVGVPVPTFDPAPMQDIQTWLGSAGAHFVFEYGQYDPWTGGAYAIGAATDTIEVTSPQGTHDDGLAALTDGDRAAAYAKLAAWTGVTPVAPSVRHPALARPRPHRHGPARGSA